MASVLICDVFWIVHGSAYSSWCCSGWCCTESSFCKGFFCCHFWNSLNFSSIFFFSFRCRSACVLLICRWVFWFIFPWGVLVMLVSKKCFVSIWSLKICCARNFPKWPGFPALRLRGFFSFLISPLSLDLSYFATRTVVFHLKSVFHYKMPFTPCYK